MDEETVSAADANRHSSKMLRAVREARAEYVITVHGRPVAKIVPIEEPDRSVAWDALMTRLRSQTAIDIGPWRREELYDC